MKKRQTRRLPDGRNCGGRVSVVVIDPGPLESNLNVIGKAHGSVNYSKAEHASLTLELSQEIIRAIVNEEGQAYAATQGKCVLVVLTREADIQLGARERASVAANNNASLFLGLQFNTADGTRRYTEALIDRKYHLRFVSAQRRIFTAADEGPGFPSKKIRNVNHVDDAEFASAIACAAYREIRAVDPDARLRSTHYLESQHGENLRMPSGVGMRAIERLQDAWLGTFKTGCKGCVLVIDFIDHPSVASLFTGPCSNAFRSRFAQTLAETLIDWA